MSVEFVDTNVLVYAYDTTAGGKRARARELLVRLWSEGKGALSIQVLQEFYVVVTRKIPRPLSPAEARGRLRNLSRWRVVRPAPEDLLAASELSEAYGLSFWDAMIVRSAGGVDAAVVWSEDLQHGRKYGKVEVRNPFL